MTDVLHYYSQSLQLNETHTISPTILNEAAFGYLKMEGIPAVTGPFSVPIVSITGQSAGVGVGSAHQDYRQHN
jgi:hypothetical protein